MMSELHTCGVVNITGGIMGWKEFLFMAIHQQQILIICLETLEEIYSHTIEERFEAGILGYER